ncbi:helix-turn-helix transcriptional regulator [Bacillus aquiflavi]|uniref:Helix-turn-helix transcriptional regulator n=1 Tax=Bacillus aquiflavi TaxID=2672567 RepID=A0A6B3VZW0_9BACI|nr:helix-turn-helix transcriptional regulator [Bacillus aquiflavi]MBA4538142.1 helix-turn-helix transcriptional regulator [Bacillus aquiflavi]NEY82462.1 helix-turn-helix transcriptional regulator [Bacillus aquiflavi]UAC48566.1 helix-turn-helix transcriptional regulator [Bacillus aquiflavi]
MKNKIQQLRKAKKLSQEDLANLCQVTRQTINAIENNKYDPTLKLAFDLASVLDTTVDQLFLYKSEDHCTRGKGKK